MAVVERGAPGQVGEGPPALDVPGVGVVLHRGAAAALVDVLEGEEQVLHAEAALAAYAGDAHAVATVEDAQPGALVDVEHLHPAQPERAMRLRHVLQVRAAELGVLLVGVARLQPEGVAAPGALGIDAHDRGVAEALLGGEVVGPAPIHVHTERIEPLAEVDPVARDQEAVAQHELLAAERDVERATCAAPADVRILQVDVALAAVGIAAGIAVAPGALCDRAQAAVQLAAAGTGGARQHAMDEALAPLPAALAEIVLARGEGAGHAVDIRAQRGAVAFVQGLCPGRAERRQSGQQDGRGDAHAHDVRLLDDCFGARDTAVRRLARRGVPLLRACPVRKRALSARRPARYRATCPRPAASPARPWPACRRRGWRCR
ncbi:MAG: hypothetical protein BWZ09_02264 [Alphaproteobacteria bacterium ADurb.BinA305]|nr:MAG: hypothetical protein BWZ09_02264 [Alphaproteobacteria bacterium ADurb.BinA305]